MKIYTGYKVRIVDGGRVFDNTVKLYRQAVSFFIDVILNRWASDFAFCKNQSEAVRGLEPGRQNSLYN